MRDSQPSSLQVLTIHAAWPIGTLKMTYVNSFIGETRWHGRAFFFGITEEDREFLDG
jgi:hypothetical protein